MIPAAAMLAESKTRRLHEVRMNIVTGLYVLNSPLQTYQQVTTGIAGFNDN
jgi:hypothetical protein